MLEASGEVVYINEPLNPKHPPGGSPGVLNGRVTHRFQYINDESDEMWLPAFRRMLDLRYGFLPELRENRSLYDLGRLAKYGAGFLWGRARGRRALVDDPYALFSVPWLARRLGMITLLVVRDPVSYVGSRLNASWRTSLGDLLDQPLLVRDLLDPHVPALREALRTDDEVVRSAVMWAVTHDVIDKHYRDLPDTYFIRYEDLAKDPVGEFGQAYAVAGLTMTSRARGKIRAATSTDRDRHRSHQWTMRVGLSKTAFRPMDASASLDSYRQRLSGDEIRQVRELTDEVFSQFGGG